MEDLFGNEIKPIKIYNRDSAGRFSDEKTAKYERALKDAGKYKQMYLAAQSRMKGMDIEIEKKEAMEAFKAELKPLNEKKQELLENIKKGSEYVENEECVKILYHEEKMAGYYNKLGELVYSRPIMPQEMQRTIFNINRKTGTES